MKSVRIIIFLALCSPVLHAQVPKSYKVNPGQKVMETIPAEAVYTYPQFKSGMVQFKNGRVGGASMNYNSLLGEMDFINDKGDTIALDDLNAVKYITFETDTFYFDKGYLRQLDANGEARLLEKKLLTLTNRQKIGGFGEINGGSVDVIDKMSFTSSPLRTMVAKEILTFTESFTYYFGDRYNHFRQAGRKTLVDMFGKKYPGLDKYLEDTRPNYFNAEDMRKVMGYLTSPK